MINWQVYKEVIKEVPQKCMKWLKSEKKLYISAWQK